MDSRQKEEDITCLCTLREIGILARVDKDRLPDQVRRGTQMVCCADSDQFGDIFDQHIDYCGCNRCAPLNHYGGALVIPAHSPASALGQSELVKDQLFLGYALGKGDIQVHLSHWPCGVANGYGLSARDCLQLLCDAQDEVSKFFQLRINNIRTYLNVLDGFSESEPTIEQICMGGKLPRREVLAIQRVHACSKSTEVMREIVMPRERDILSHFHVDWPVEEGQGKRKRTYHLSREQFREWNATN